MKLKVGLIYGAAGSAAVAARNLGMDVLSNYETRGTHFLETFKKNFGGIFAYDHAENPVICFCDELPELYSHLFYDILIGQPDCKMFSNLRTRKKEEVDIKRTQLADFFHHVSSLRPRAFIVENLPKAIDAIFPLLTTDPSFLYKPDGGNGLIDYGLTQFSINAERFIPQHRIRSFIVGIERPTSAYYGDQHYLSNFTYSQSYLTTALSCRTLLKDLENPDSYNLFNNHKPHKHSAERIKGFSKLKIGESYYGTQNNRRINPDRAAPTITSHCTQHVHYSLPRTLSVRENARLMGWPDNFIFSGGTTKQLDQVGKAIVVPVIQDILFQLGEYLSDNNSD